MSAPAKPPRCVPRRVVFLSVCALGVSSILTQLVMMRELLGVLAGNEMTFGIILGNWLLLTGLGAWLGRGAARIRRPLRLLAGAQVLVAVLPIACVLALRTLRNVIFVRGAMIGVTAAVASCFVLLLPYCLITGFLLTLACRLLAARQDARSIGQVYFLDVLGDIAGGAVFTFVLVGLLDHFRILYVPAFLNLLFAGVLALMGRCRIVLGAACAAAVALGAAAAVWDLDEISRNIEYAGRRVVYRGDSPYGSLIVTASAGQYDVISNGLPLFSTGDVVRVEETVHYAMVQRPDARRVLLIAGGISGTAKEIRKYGAAVDYVELDPLILTVARRFAPENLDETGIEVINTDGRLFVRQTDRRYDVVIADLPDPGTFQLNRFYTAEFFADVKRILRPGGVLGFSLGQYDNYVSDRLGDLIATAHHTLRGVFGRVIILPGGQVFFLASDGPLDADIAGRIEAAGVTTRHVRREYLRGTLTEGHLADLARPAARDAPVNRDFSPVLCYYHLRHWISRFAVRVGIFEAALLLAFAIYVVRLRAVPLAIFTTGFSAAGLEVVLLAGFQILYGSVYRRVGLIVTTFMLGLAIGALISNRRRHWGRRALIGMEFAVAGWAAATPFALMALGRFEATAGAWGEAGVALLTGGLAMLVGMEFPLAARAEFDRVAPTASRLYTADLLGACAGALLVSTLLLPLIGIVGVCLLAAALNVLSGGGLLVRKR